MAPSIGYNPCTMSCRHEMRCTPNGKRSHNSNSLTTRLFGYCNMAMPGWHALWSNAFLSIVFWSRSKMSFRCFAKELVALIAQGTFTMFNHAIHYCYSMQIKNIIQWDSNIQGCPSQLVWETIKRDIANMGKSLYRHILSNPFPLRYRVNIVFCKYLRKCLSHWKSIDLH